MTPLEGTLSGHLSAVQLGGLLEGFDGPAEAFESLLHLRLCRDCRARLVNDFPADGPELVHEFNLDNRPQPPLASVSGARSPRRADGDGSDSATSAILKSWGTGSKAVAAELLGAPTLARDLERVVPARQHLALEARRYQTLGFAIYLLRRSSTLWNVCPSESYRLAQLALAIVTKLERSAYPLGLKADIECRSLAYVGNALRLTGRLDEAKGKLTDALNGLERGTGDLRLRAHVLEILAELHRDQRLFPQALLKAREARELYEVAGDGRRAAWSSVVVASILGTKGDTRGAIRALRHVLESASRSVMGEDVYWVARQNLSHRLVEDGQLWAARCELKEVKRWARHIGKPLMSARVLWVEALLTAREGDWEGAARRLGRVRDVFLSYDLPYDAALACLDLAALYLRKGRLDVAQDLAGILAPVFRASGIQRETLASLRLLADALRKRTATTAQVEMLQRHFTCQRRRDNDD